MSMRTPWTDESQRQLEDLVDRGEGGPIAAGLLMQMQGIDLMASALGGDPAPAKQAVWDQTMDGMEAIAAWARSAADQLASRFGLMTDVLEAASHG